MLSQNLKIIRLDGDLEDLPTMEPLQEDEKKALKYACLAIVAGIALFFWSLSSPDSAWRDASGALTSNKSPLMGSIVPLIFLLFLIPGLGIWLGNWQGKNF